MTNEEKISQLEKDVAELKQLISKDEYSNLKIFRKQVQFKSDVNFDNINKVTLTGGTAPIADGVYQLTTASGYYIKITTKNGIITNLED